MSENSRVIKAAGVVGAATLLSRTLGYIRDAVIAWYFGAGLNSDAFIAAFRIPNLLRKLLGEGSISNAFVPVLTDYLAKDGKQEALRLARSALWVMSIVLVAVSISGIILSPLIVKIIAPGFIESPGKISLTIVLTRIMFPYIFFIGLVALCMGILNVFGHFATPALAPVLLNLAMILSVFFLCPHFSQPVMGLAAGVMIGGVLQLVLQLPAMVRKGFLFRQKRKIWHPGLKKIGQLMLPVIFGGAVYQINTLVDQLLGSLLIEGSITYLYFADRLVQFPLGIFAIAAATAVLPSLSRQAATNDVAALKDTFSLVVPERRIQPAGCPVDCRGAFILCYRSMGFFGSPDRCRYFFRAQRHPDTDGDGDGLHPGQYRAGNLFDGPAGSRRAGPGDIACLGFEPRTAGVCFASQARFPGMEKNCKIRRCHAGQCRHYGRCGLDGCAVAYRCRKRRVQRQARVSGSLRDDRPGCFRSLLLFNR